MRTGPRLGIDVGAVRIGVAVCDPSGLLATPVETVVAGKRRALARLVALASEHEVVEVVVGLPLSLSGEEGSAAEAARTLASGLASALASVPVRLVDERLSTVTATAALRGSGVPGRKQRAVVDQAAATVILQAALDAERSAGRPPGELVEVAPSAVTRPRRPRAAGDAAQVRCRWSRCWWSSCCWPSGSPRACTGCAVPGRAPTTRGPAAAA